MNGEVVGINFAKALFPQRLRVSVMQSQFLMTTDTWSLMNEETRDKADNHGVSKLQPRVLTVK